MRFDEVPVHGVHVPEWHRPIDDKQVTEMAESIRRLGLLQPIGLGPDQVLLFGRLRLAAFEELGRETIRACIFDDINEVDGRLATVHENLMRQELSTKERADALLLAKELYEVVHPDSARSGGKAGKMDASPSFVAAIAAATGKSKSTIRKRIASTKPKPAKKPPEPKKETEEDLVVAKLARHGGAKATESEEIKDALGNIVPTKFREVFEKATDFDKALNLCTQLTKAMNALREDATIGIVFASKAVAAKALRTLEEVRHAIKFGRPHTICPYCKGRGCEPCMNTGWCNADVYKSAPKDMRKSA